MTTQTLAIDRRLTERRRVERRFGVVTPVSRAVDTAQHPATTAARLRAGRVARWIGKSLVNLTLLCALLVFLGLAVGPHLFGYRTMTMLTGSMAPQINPGDVTVVTPLPSAQVRPGMIISYHIPVQDHRVVTHRVIAVTPGPNGSTTVQTKGDANNGKDPWTATLQGNTAYQVRGVVPALGTTIRFLRTPLVGDALLYGVPAILAGWVMFSLWGSRKTGGRLPRRSGDAE
jgi:signal peptidase I